MTDFILPISENRVPKARIPDRIDPRISLIGLIVLYAALIISHRMVFSIVIFALCSAAFLWMKTGLRRIVRRLWPSMGIVIVIVLIKALTYGQTRLAAFSLFGQNLAMYQEGIILGAEIGLRVLACINLLTLFFSLTPAHQFFRALHWLRLPKLFLEIAFLMHRYVLVLAKDALNLHTAQKTRLGYQGFVRSTRSAGDLMGRILIRSCEQSTRIYQAMLLRGYIGEIPIGPMKPLTRHDALILVFMLAATGMLFALFGGAWS